MNYTIQERVAVVAGGGIGKGVSRVQFSRFINARSGVTSDLAIRLFKWIPAPTAIMWLQMQADYNLWQAEHSGRQMKVEPARTEMA